MSLPKNIKDGAKYDIKVSRTVNIGALKARPTDKRIVVSGKTLKTIKDAVIEAKEVK